MYLSNFCATRETRGLAYTFLALSLEGFDKVRLHRDYWDIVSGRYQHRMFTDEHGRNIFFDNVERGASTYYVAATATTRTCCACGNTVSYHEVFDYWRDTPLTLVNGDWYCPDCAEEAHAMDGLGGTTYKGLYVPKDKESSKYNDDYTKECLGTVHSYDWAPEPFTFVFAEVDRLIRPRLYLGTEIELDNGGRSDKKCNMVLATLTGLEKYAYAMSDGSLNDGFEIGTMPATLAAHTMMLNYKEAFDLAVRLGYTANSNSSSGLHVHINRKFFGEDREEQLYRGALLTMIIERNWEDIRSFARRESSSINRWSTNRSFSQGLSEDCTPDQLRSRFTNCYADNKYVCCNLMHNNTFELRIFKGTLSTVAYLGTLQFVSNLAHMAREITIADARKIKLKDIVDYKHYPELDAYYATPGTYDGGR